MPFWQWSVSQRTGSAATERPTVLQVLLPSFTYHWVSLAYSNSSVPVQTDKEDVGNDRNKGASQPRSVGRKTQLRALVSTPASLVAISEPDIL